MNGTHLILTDGLYHIMYYIITLLLLSIFGKSTVVLVHYK